MADPLGDPNAKINDPTGGAPNFNIKDVFNSFGYYPTQEEITAMSGAFEGTYNVGQIGTSAVAQYVNQKRAEAERQKNDPLAALQKKMDDSVALMKNQVTGLYAQLQDTLSAAPKLFGELTPDQIQAYLAPLKTSFDQQVATVQGVIGQRGLSGSSTENNALAQTGQQFQQNVLSTGLQVGLDAQKNKAASIQQQINNLFGLTGQEEGIAANATGQKSVQDLGQSNLIASLPYFLTQSAQQQQLIQKQLQGGGGFWDTFNKVTSGINQGVDALQSIAMVPSQFKTSPTQPATPGGSAPNLPGYPGMSTSTAAPISADLFATV